MDLSAIVPGNVLKKPFKPKRSNADRLVLQINHKTRKKQTIRLLHSTFDSKSNTLALLDQGGEVYFVDFTSCRYWTIPLIVNCSVLKFSPLKLGELLFGCHNGNVTIVHSHSGAIVETLTGHGDAVKELLFIGDVQLLSSTCHEAILWDLAGNCKLHVLNLKADVSLSFMCFVPVANQILACFQDNTMHVWSNGEFDVVKTVPSSTWRFKIKTVAVTRDGRAAVFAGNSANLTLFCTKSWESTKTITLPKEVLSVRRLAFVPRPFDGGANKLLAALTGNGRILLFDMNATIVVAQVAAEHEILQFCTSPGGAYVACTLSSGSMHVYDCAALLPPDLTVPADKPSKRRPAATNQKLRHEALQALQAATGDLLHVDKLRRVLKLYGQYPDAHRVAIWSRLLQLPRNLRSFRALRNSPAYRSPYLDLEKLYPLQDKRALKSLKSLLTTLTTWCPFLGTVGYLPLLVFPFVKVFTGEPLLLFEATSGVLVNHCQLWFQYHPLAPLNVLAIVENLLLEQEPDLVAFYSERGVSSQVYAWPLLQTAFSEVLNARDWCIIWDHVLTNEPGFLLLLVVAYNLSNKSAIMGAETAEEIAAFFRAPNTSSGSGFGIKRLLAKAYEVLATDSTSHPRRFLQPFQAFVKGAYPHFRHYPADLFTGNESLEAERDLEVENKRLEEIRESRDLERRSLVNKETEEQRLNELEKLCELKMHEENLRLDQKREHLAKLRKLLREEEIRMLSASRRSFDAQTCRDKQRALRKILQQLERGRHQTSTELLKTETDMISHYAKLLKSRTMVEALFKASFSDEPGEALAEQRRALDEEIGRVQSTIDKKKLVKQEGAAEGLGALNELIGRVEVELSRAKFERDETSQLTVETKELEVEVGQLLQILQRSKSSCDYEEFNEQFIRSQNLAHNT